MWDNYCNLCRKGAESGNDSIAPFFACVYLTALMLFYVGTAIYCITQLIKLSRESKKR